MFLDRMKRGSAPILYGGAQSNDFTYVCDVVQANLLAVRTTHTREVYNVGTGQEVTTDQAVAVLRELTGYVVPEERLPMRAVDAPRFVMDIGKASRMLGYSPHYSLADGLAAMLGDAKENHTC